MQFRLARVLNYVLNIDKLATCEAYLRNVAWNTAMEAEHNDEGNHLSITFLRTPRKCECRFQDEEVKSITHRTHDTYCFKMDLKAQNS